MAATVNAFESTSYTVDEYKHEALANPSMSLVEHAELICKCIASSTDGFIVKRSGATDGDYKIVEVSERDLKNVLSFSVPFKKEEKKIDAEGNEYIKKASISSKNIVDVIKNAESRPPNMAHYFKLVMVAHNPHDLGLYVPPQGPFDVALGRALVDFMRSRVKNPRAFDEEISSHAYRLRYPDAWIEKCFVHFGVAGNSGKTFLAGMLGSLYPKLANVGVRHTQLTENANGWTTDYLMIHVEELEGDEYLTKDFQGWIKRATTREASVRKMYRDAYAGENNAIIGLNTNKKDLYGLLYGDEALLSRLVILEFNDPLTPDQWKDQLKTFGLDATDPNYMANKLKLAASLWHYLRYEYEIVERFNPCRYFEPEKTELVKRLRQSAGSVPHNFVNSLEKFNDENRNNYTTVFEVVQKRSGPTKDKPMIMARVKAIRDAWTAYLRDKRGAQANYSFDKSVEPLLEQIGLEKKHTRDGDVWMMDAVEFDKWYDSKPQMEAIDLSDYDVQ